MSRNIFQDYVIVTGYLPVLKDPFPHGGAVGHLQSGETWKTEEKVREYMGRRFGGNYQRSLKDKHFDPKHSMEVINARVWDTTITRSGEVKDYSQKTLQMDNSVQPRALPSDVPMPKVGFGSGNAPEVVKKGVSAGAVGIGAMVVVLAIAVMFLRGGNK